MVYRRSEMALETLKHVGEIGGFEVFHENHTYDRPEKHILVNHGMNVVSFKLQNGGVKENGVNGCQVDTMLKTVYQMLSGLNGKYPSTHNLMALIRIDEAIKLLDARTKERTERGVEGKEQA